MIVREIQSSDNNDLVEVVLTVMKEFKADPKTTIIGDPSLHTMYQNYREERSVYYIVESENKIVGGCGIRHLENASNDICELQRMFLLKEARNNGIGKKLLGECISKAKEFDYKYVYLETLSDMTKAISLYESNGFKRISKAMGTTGHSGCDLRMLLEL